MNPPVYRSEVHLQSDPFWIVVTLLGALGVGVIIGFVLWRALRSKRKR